MAKKTSENKIGVAEKAAAAEVKTMAAENALPATKSDTDTTAHPAIDTNETSAAETGIEVNEDEQFAGNGFRFNVSADGLVEVISERRAGKSVTGATGDIITFDNKGIAKVKLEDAVHFSHAPGFSFK